MFRTSAPRCALCSILCLFLVSLAAFPANDTVDRGRESVGAAEYDPVGPFLTFATDYPVERWSMVRFDDDGVPMVRYGDQYYYNPATIAIWGLQNFSNYSLGRLSHLDAAVRAGQWLHANQDLQTGGWNLDVAVFPEGFAVEPPFVSALGQGLGISLLTRLHHVTGDGEFLEAARRATLPFDEPIADGGVRAELFGHPYFEEFATNPPLFTLNGMLFAVIGLYDLSQAGDERAQELFQDGLDTVEFSLPFFDTGAASTYNLKHIASPPLEPAIANHAYHELHVGLLRALHSISGDALLGSYVERWSDYSDRSLTLYVARGFLEGPCSDPAPRSSPRRR